MSHTERMLIAGQKARQAGQTTREDVTREAIRRAAAFLGIEAPQPAAVRLENARRILA